MTFIDPIVCRCGVRKDLHPRSDCKRVRRSYWWHRHYLWRHLATRVWWLMSDKQRWWVADQMASTRRDWCGLVDSVIHAGTDYRSDYQGKWGCPCDFPLPTDVGPPRYGECYCVPGRARP